MCNFAEIFNLLTLHIICTMKNKIEIEILIKKWKMNIKMLTIKYNFEWKH